MSAAFPEDCAALFEPVKLIARGGCGSVYLARQLRLRRMVAVKLLDVSLAPDSEPTRRFLREARVTAQLAHPGVIEIVDHGAATGVPWITYEYIEGGSLRGKLDPGPLSVEDSVEAIRQVAAALGAAHGHGILHRDVKPENVLVAGPHAYKLTDFGLAYWSSSTSIATATGVVLGTPAYLAPELLCDEEPTPAVDVYALAVMLYALIAGREPFVAPSIPELLRLHLDAPPPSLSAAVPGAPRALDTVIARGMAKRPAERFTTPLQLVEAMDAALLTPSGRHTRAAPRVPSGASRGGAPASGANRTAASSRPAAPRNRASDTAPTARPPATPARAPFRVPVAVVVAAGLALATARFAPRERHVAPSASPAAAVSSASPATPAGSSPLPSVASWRGIREVIDPLDDQATNAKGRLKLKQAGSLDQLINKGADVRKEAALTARLLEALTGQVRTAVAARLVGEQWLKVSTTAANIAALGGMVEREERITAGESHTNVEIRRWTGELSRVLAGAAYDPCGRLASRMYDVESGDLFGSPEHIVERIESAADDVDAFTRESAGKLDVRRAATLGSCWRRLLVRARGLDSSTPRVGPLILRFLERQRDVALELLRGFPGWSTDKSGRERMVEALDACAHLLEAESIVGAERVRTVAAAEKLEAEAHSPLLASSEEDDWRKSWDRIQRELGSAGRRKR